MLLLFGSGSCTDMQGKAFLPSASVSPGGMQRLLHLVYTHRAPLLGMARAKQALEILFLSRGERDAKEQLMVLRCWRRRGAWK